MILRSFGQVFGLVARVFRTVPKGMMQCSRCPQRSVKMACSVHLNLLHLDVRILVWLRPWRIAATAAHMRNVCSLLVMTLVWAKGYTYSSDHSPLLVCSKGLFRLESFSDCVCMHFQFLEVPASFPPARCLEDRQHVQALLWAWMQGSSAQKG